MRQYPEKLSPADLKESFELLYESSLEAVLEDAKIASEISDKSSIKRGSSENWFASHLSYFFSNKIYIDIALWVFREHYKATLKPDFVLYDSRSNFHLAIEIDEPYVLETGQPIHFVAQHGDDYWTDADTILVENFRFGRDLLEDVTSAPFETYDRSILFLQSGWFLVRFSENQVVKFPRECCKFIYDSIPAIVRTAFDESIFRGISNVPNHPRWTQAEAEKLAEQKYRLQYLSDLNYSERSCEFLKQFADYKIDSHTWASRRKDDLPF